MAVALTLHEQRRCSGCGHSTHLTHDMNKLGEYEVKTSVCLACEALEKARDQAQEQSRRTPGEKVFVLDGGPGD